MIPASYLYKDAYTQAWGDPSNMHAEAAACDPRGPHKGHPVGLIGLLVSMLPLETERHKRLIRHA